MYLCWKEVYQIPTISQTIIIESGINVGLRLVILGLFSRGLVYWFLDFCIILTFFSFGYVIKVPIICYLKRRGYAYSRSYTYCFFKTIPEATFIPGATSIPDSRVDH